MEGIHWKQVYADFKCKYDAKKCRDEEKEGEKIALISGNEWQGGVENS